MKVSSNYVPERGACWYKLSVYAKGYRGIKLSGLNSKRVNVSVYKQVEFNDFEYVGTYENNYDELTFEVDYLDSLYVVVVPTTNYMGGFELTTQLYGSTELSGGAITGIVLGSIAFVALTICFCLW